MTSLMQDTMPISELGTTAKFGMRTTSVAEQFARAKSGALTRWLIDGIIVQGGSTLLYAQPGAGKSLVALDLALAASQGRPWLSQYGIEQIGVLYLDEDGNNDHEINARLIAFGADQGNDRLHFGLHQGFRITSKTARQEMINGCLKMGVGLVIMDSLTRLHDLAEGSSDGMKVVNAAIKDYTMAGISVLILHHASKRGRGARGSSEIESGYDAIYRMEKVDDTTFRIINTKARSVGSSGVWHGCTIVTGKDENGRLVLDGGYPLEDEEGADSAADTPVQKRAKIWDGVIYLLTESEKMTETAIASTLGISGRDKTLLKSVLTELAKAEKVFRSKRGNGYDYYLMSSGECSDPYDGDDESAW